ncbi:MAG TPA: hypothetical protein VF188_02840 [Longimicrobiales bacterium]
MARAVWLALCLIAALRPALAFTQDTTRAGPQPDAATRPVRTDAWRPLRVAKWATLGTAILSVGYGFAASLAADTRYDRIEAACAAADARCERRSASGAYADAQLQRLHDEAQRLDGRARLALLAGQVAAAASVLLFILDLQENPAPPNVPYEPPRIRLAPSTDGGARLTVRVPVP